MGTPPGCPTWGSPPRGRGRRSGPCSPPSPCRLTPARAGTAQPSSATVTSSGAHPRAGGDGDIRRWRQPLASGSPPRGRGRRTSSQDTLDGVGLTPARAGTAPESIRRMPSSRAHPRAGGDGAGLSSLEHSVAGSPPRGRGRQQHLLHRRRGRGLTPARAGTALRSPRPPWPSGAHPRAGGDGRIGLGAGVVVPGLTPARAGTAWARQPLTSLRRAHPRAGGDGVRGRSGSRSVRGSPPRGRGRPSLCGESRSCGGLTPARAGTARPTRRWPCRRWAHPRAGGDGG